MPMISSFCTKLKFFAQVLILMAAVNSAALIAQVEADNSAQVDPFEKAVNNLRQSLLHRSTELTQMSLENFFDILEAEPDWVEKHFNLLIREMHSTSTRLSGRYYQVLGGNFQPLHRLFWGKITSYLNNAQFAARFENRNSARLILPLMARQVVLIQNRRMPEAEDLNNFFKALNDKVPQLSSLVKMPEFLDWYKNCANALQIAKKYDGSQFHQIVADQIKQLVAERQKASEILYKSQLKKARGDVSRWFNAVKQSAASMGLDADQAESMLVDMFNLSLHPDVKIDGLPLFVYWYYESDSHPSLVPLMFRDGTARLGFMPDEDYEGLNIGIANDNIQHHIMVPPALLTDEVIKATEQALLESKGDYYLAVMPVNRNFVKLHFKRTGSYDFTGEWGNGFFRGGGGEFAISADHLKKAIEQNPYLRDCYMILSQIHRNTNSGAEALLEGERILDKEIEICSENYLAWSSKGIINKALARDHGYDVFDKSEECFKRALKINPYHASTLMSYATAIFDNEERRVEALSMINTANEVINIQSTMPLEILQQYTEAYGVDFFEEMSKMPIPVEIQY